MTSKILDDGLRYKTKKPGSPFLVSSNFRSRTMSCFLCGKHRDRALMVIKKFMGKNHAVCSPSCKEMEAKIAAAASNSN